MIRGAVAAWRAQQRAEPLGSAHFSLFFSFNKYHFHVPKHLPKEDSSLGNNKFI
jgi:hypothetical protein